MNKKALHTVAVLLLFIFITALCGCGRISGTAEPARPAADASAAGTPGVSPLPEPGAETEELTDEAALSAVRNYCCRMNPDLEELVNNREYPVYWEISSSDEQTIVVLFRSYTGAQTRYYINRSTGETYAAEYVPGISMEEQRTEESFNIRDYLSVS